MTAPSGTGRAVWSEEAACALSRAVRVRWDHLNKTTGLVRDSLNPDRGDPSAATFDRIARGQPPVKPVTQWGVEDVLGWERGTLEAIRRNPSHDPQLAPKGRPASRLVEIPAGDDALPVLATLLEPLTHEEMATVMAYIRTRRARAS